MQTAVRLAGGQSALARRLNVRQGTIWKWLRSGKPGAEYVLEIEQTTGVSRHDLRRDVFGPEHCAIRQKNIA